MVDEKPKHNKIKWNLLKSLNKFDEYNALREWMVETKDDRRRVDVIMRHRKWRGMGDGLEYAFEIKQNNSSLRDLEQQLNDYEESGRVPVPVVPLPGAAVNNNINKLRKSPVVEFEKNPNRGVVYYDSKLNWYVQNPYYSGLTRTEWPRIRGGIYSDADCELDPQRATSTFDYLPGVIKKDDPRTFSDEEKEIIEQLVNSLEKEYESGVPKQELLRSAEKKGISYSTGSIILISLRLVGRLSVLDDGSIKTTNKK